MCISITLRKIVLNFIKQLITKFHEARKTPQAGISESWVHSTDSTAGCDEMSGNNKQTVIITRDQVPKAGRVSLSPCSLVQCLRP